MTTTPDVFAALQSALTNLSTALVTGRPDAVLEAEAPLHEATYHFIDWVQSQQTLGADAARVRAGAIAIRTALLQCRALGEAADVLRRVVVPDLAYAGTGPQRPRAIATLESRM